MGFPFRASKFDGCQDFNGTASRLSKIYYITAILHVNTPRRKRQLRNLGSFHKIGIFASNSLVVSVAADFALADELKSLIDGLDQAPDTIKIQAVLKNTVNGETTVLGVPQIILRDNSMGSVTLGTENGEFTIELTVNIIKKSDSTDTEPRTAKQTTQKTQTNSR